MALPPPLSQGFLHLPLTGIAAAGETLDRIVAGALLGVVVQGFYESAALAVLADRMAAEEDLPPAIPFAHFKDDDSPPYERGLALDSASHSLHRYVADAVRQRAFLILRWA